MSILDQEISKEDFDKLSDLHKKKKDYHDFLKQIYKPLKFDYSTCCDIEEYIVHQDDPNEDPIGMYVGCISCNKSKLYVLLKFQPPFTEDFNVLAPWIFDSNEDGIALYKEIAGKSHGR